MPELNSYKTYFFAGFGAGAGAGAGAAGAGAGAGTGVTTGCAGGGDAACFFSQPKKAKVATMTRTRMATMYFFTKQYLLLEF